jgi:cellulose biosynthesis protein BcsQ
MKASPNRHRAIRIALYNHKGGVGKTSLTLNVAYALAELGKRVLLVDVDPQCNLTSYLIEDSVVDDLLDSSDSQKGNTLWSAVKPVSEGNGDPRVIEPFEIAAQSNMFLLAGDIQLSGFESDLAQAWGECFQRKIKGLRATSSISAVVNSVCRAKKIDFVFFDSGPSIGPLNRVVILDCDYVIIPAACDLFSVRALKTMGHTLANWVQDWMTISALAPQGIYLLPGEPRILGYIPQRFRIYRGQLASAQESYVAKIEKHVFSDVVSVLRGVNPSLAPSSISQLRLGAVKDFGSIASLSQAQGVPFEMVEGSNGKQLEEARKVFQGIARKILTQTSAVSP